MDILASFVTTCIGRRSSICKQMDVFCSLRKIEAQWNRFEHIIITDIDTKEHLEQHPIDAVIIGMDVDIGSPFNKSKLMNDGARLVNGKRIIPLDADLVPLFNLNSHLALFELETSVIISGYRVNVTTREEDGATFTPTFNTVCPEDYPSALESQLLDQERFGVCPVIDRDVFKSVGGYDEEFVGWGAEDQDLIERVQVAQGPLVRAPTLLWGHLHHPTNETGWNDAHLTEENRKRYYAKRSNVGDRFYLERFLQRNGLALGKRTVGE